MADPSEVTLLRNASPTVPPKLRDQIAERPVPRRVRKPNGAPPPEPAQPTGGVDPEDRLRHITAVVMLLSAVLLFLALVSYTAEDQANADIGVRDLIGLMTNDPVVAARADTTMNWLGLMGAFVADFLINGTVGFMALALPFLLVWWGIAVYRGVGYAQQTRMSVYAALIMTLVASVFGTVQLITWLPQPSHEWSGAIGAFFATLLAGLLGTAGAMIILLAALGFAAVFAFDLDIRHMAQQTWGFLRGARRRLAEFNARVAGLEETTPADGGTLAAGVPEPRSAAADNEPARMTRRMRAPDGDGGQQRFSEPRIRRPEAPPLPMFDVAASQISQVQPPLPGDVRAREAQILPPQESQQTAKAASGTETPAPIAIGPRSPAPAPGDVNITHESPQLEPTRTARLTLQVQDGETEHDQETGDDGSLIERLRNEQIKYVPPSIDLLVPQAETPDVRDEELKENGRVLQDKLATFNIQIENLTVTPGPVVTLFEFVPARGIKIAQIESLADDIALALKARGIRIIAPIPGKGTVGVEIPNHKPAMVRIRSVLNTARFRESNFRLPIALGKTTVGEVFCDDLTKMPHLLIAGATGSGKSVGVNAILASLVYRMHPSELKFVIIDPKKIEMTQYRALKDHFLARCPDIDEEIITQPQNAVLALKALELEMDRRYDILAKVGQRNIFDYNQKVAEGRFHDHGDFHHAKLPYIVLVLDELADLMMTAQREVEEPIARLAQLARAIGIHLVVATQRPSVDVITGVIKANFPARIAYQVASKIDSRTILDMNGAEYLLGNGDMLYLPGGAPKPLRLQNAFISTEEVEEICEHIGRQKGYSQPYWLPSVVEKAERSGTSGAGGDRDELFEEAARLVVMHQQGSVSLVQRRLKVGYSRAARIVDELEMAGIVGPFDGSKARAVLIESEADLEAFL
jgi:S-DNA-T family DNA segregation ATPase FtsK/SpoIIIE